MQLKLLREICSFGNWLCSQHIETFSSIFPLWSSIFIFFLMNLYTLIRCAYLLWILLYRSYQLLKIQLCVCQHLYYSDDLFFCTAKSFVAIDSICLLYSQKLMFPYDLLWLDYWSLSIHSCNIFTLTISAFWSMIATHCPAQ